MKPSIRSVIPAAALLLSGGVIGATTTHFASATIGSGDRPVTVPIVACRLVDTRPPPLNIGNRSTPLGDRQAMTVKGRGQSGECNIPSDAVGLVLNVTAVNASRQTNLRVYPADAPLPGTSNLNPAPGQAPTPNAVTTDLAGNGNFKIFNWAGSVDIVVDVNAYLANHDHDDRYYTAAQVNQKIANNRGPAGPQGDPGPPGATPSVATAWGRADLGDEREGVLVASVEGFRVPEEGGALSVSADLRVSGASDGMAYISLDGDGSCLEFGGDGGQLVGFNPWFTFVFEFAAFYGEGTASVVGAVPVTAGTHWVDLCVSGGLSGGVASGVIVATWIPSINEAGLDEPCFGWCLAPESG